MKTRTMWTIIAVVAVLALVTGGAGTLTAQRAPAAKVDSSINYQGRLTDPGGSPLNGTYSMTFEIYDDPSVGAKLWDSGSMKVTVDDGLFNVELGVDHADFDGQGLWLRMQVDGEWLSPRQKLTPVPYALSLRPGAIIRGEPTVWQGWLLQADMQGAYPLASALEGTAATGYAVHGASAGGYGLFGYSEIGNAVVGTSITKTAGVFFTEEGYGIDVTTQGGDHWDHAGNFHADRGYGVNAESMRNYGVYGFSPVRQGVFGDSTNHSGVLGSSDNWSGVDGSSTNDYGVEGDTFRGDQNYGVYTADNLYSKNYNLSGAIMQVAQNGGDEPLEPGDVVVFAGVVEPEAAGGPLVVQVDRAIEADSTAVAGVVYSRFNLEAVKEENRQRDDATGDPQEVTMDGPVPAGGHLLLVVQGPAQVKASALGGAIQPGDLLSSAGQDGRAAKAPTLAVEGGTMAPPGAVFGKALEPLDGERDLIYVYVTLQ